jgi:predicted amidohydrolase YtcJ
MGISRSILDLYQRRVEAGEFALRVYAFADGAGETLDWLCEKGKYEDRSGRLSMRAVKFYIDGAMGSRGAALLTDYSDDPGNQGLLFMPPEAMEANIDKALSCGLQVGIHAIGDRGNRAVLDALESVTARYPESPGRHRIEHAQTLTPEDIPRFAELDVIAAIQPIHATSDMYWVEDRLGPERIRFAYAWRKLLGHGARLALGSDFPVEQVNPILGIHAAVTRQDARGWPRGGWYAEQRLNRQEVLRGFTIDAAYAAFMEQRVGSLEPGKRADFIVLDKNLLEVEASEIITISVMQTWLDGEQVYSSD